MSTGTGGSTAGDPASVRLDVWLWSARMYPTRSAATAACRGGHVRVGGDGVKASQKVAVGDEIVMRFPRGRERRVVVTRLLAKRVGAPVAREAYEDHSPPPPAQLLAPPPRRAPGSGRPTKRERRQLDRLRGRELPAPMKPLEDLQDLRGVPEARSGRPEDPAERDR